MNLPSLGRIAKKLGWTRDSYVLFSSFVLLCGLIVYAWWPLAEELLAYIDWGGPWWLYFDWLLVGIWFVMSLLIMAGANLKADAWIIFVGFVGGLVIESWGTQTEIWWYYTAERPPFWIIPAWPIASLSIDRLVRLARNWIKQTPEKTQNFGEKNLGVQYVSSVFFKTAYWMIFIAFFVFMLIFIWPTMDKSLTMMATFLVAFLILAPSEQSVAVLTFLAGSGLGYFLEYWGTTRQCWTYYTLAKPPFFAVLAHGMAAVAFWRTVLVLQIFKRRLALFAKQSGANGSLNADHSNQGPQN